MNIEILKERADIIRQTRAFFDGKNYLETDTPLLSPDLIPESCLEVFETTRLPPHGSKNKSEQYYLIPSPEIWMKKLISEHRQNIYQICKCFRNGESSGHQHSPEFTMLEYYTMNADYMDSLAITEDLFNFLLKKYPGKNDLRPPFIKISMEEAFFKWAGFDLYKKASINGGMEEEALRLGLQVQELSVPVLYDLIFIHAVEPNLPMDSPVALIDYPAFVPCLAKKHKNGLSVERWELYVKKLELANCFSEERDAENVKEFFINEQEEKQKKALVKHKIDEEYWKNFLDFPESSGVALGLDRLIMAITGRSKIDEVLPFPMQ